MMNPTRSLGWIILLVLLAVVNLTQAFVQLSVSFAKAPTVRYATEELELGNIMEKLQDSSIMEKIQVDMPSFDGIPESVKSINMANIDVNTLSDNPAILAAVALVVLGVGAAAAAGGESGDDSSAAASSTGSKAAPKPKKPVKGPDLSIPYDAAARAAYDAWCTANEEKFSADGFAYYQELFLAKAVAEAAAKKRSRDLDGFQNKGRPEIPVRQMKPVVQEEIPLYFANEQS